MNRFRHILVPVDFTSKNKEAIETATEIAKTCSARITLFHVVESIPQESDDPLIGFYRSLEENARRRLDSMAKPLREAGIEVLMQVLVGKPARKIVSESSVLGVDLIVLSSHPLGQSDHAGKWATVSYQVSVFCRCAVLLVK